MARRTPLLVCAVTILSASVVLRAQVASNSGPRAVDPGVRSGPAGAGGPVAGLDGNQTLFFMAGLEDFEEVEAVEEGLGPRMNLDSCAGCHTHPAVGGTSPFVNPQVAFATSGGKQNRVPSFITLNGPIREVRFVRNPDGSADGGVHALFTIAGHVDAPGCNLRQDDFDAEFDDHNAIFRIPTPVFGLGLVEQIPDWVIKENKAANSSLKNSLGISGRFNTSGNDGTITRFGWKAQNKSLSVFSGEAYNVEMGITNELFQTEREEKQDCQFAKTPNDVTNTDAETTDDVLNGAERFAFFMRLLAAPEPSTSLPGGGSSIANGKQLFRQVGCNMCHTQSLQTGNSTIAALRNQDVNLFSDLLVHDMGQQLADGVTQGAAGSREFRTAPLWGLGKRIFFMHDGRTRNLISAIQLHQSSGSEANTVIQRFNSLTERQKQDLLNFLRSL